MHIVREDQVKDEHCLCLPWAKTPGDRDALIDIATSGHPQIGCGLDSAPHDVSKKEGIADPEQVANGAFSAPSGYETTLEKFVAWNRPENFEKFVYTNATKFFGLPPIEGTIRFERKNWVVPHNTPWENGYIVNFRAGDTITWQRVR